MVIWGEGVGGVKSHDNYVGYLYVSGSYVTSYLQGWLKRGDVAANTPIQGSICTPPSLTRWVLLPHPSLLNITYTRAPLTIFAFVSGVVFSYICCNCIVTCSIHCETKAQQLTSFNHAGYLQGRVYRDSVLWSWFPPWRWQVKLLELTKRSLCWRVLA